MNNLKYYSKEEDLVILRTLEEHNKRDTVKICAKLLKRSVNSIYNRIKRLQNGNNLKIKKPYTKEDDKVILRYINQNADSYTAAFQLAAKELNRTFSSIQQHWYQHLRYSPKNIKEKIWNYMFGSFVVSGKKALINCKNRSKNSYRLEQPMGQKRWAVALTIFNKKK